MAKQYDNGDSGAMFKNVPKDDQPLPANAPGYTGRVFVNCPCCDQTFRKNISGWVKTAGPESKTPGEQFMSLKLQNPKPEQATKPLF